MARSKAPDTGHQSERLNAAIRHVLSFRRKLPPLVHELGSMIVSGQLPPGQSMSEKMFGGERQVSRTSFREAVKVLQGKGLVRARQRLGTVVAPREDWHSLDPEVLVWRLSQGDVESFLLDFFRFRQLVEPAAVELAASNRQPAALERLREALETMREVESTDPFGDAFVEADLTFHQSVLLASGNEFFMALSNILEVPMSLVFTLTTSLQLSPSLELHENVVREIERGRAKQAREASLALVSRVSSELSESIASPKGRKSASAKPRRAAGKATPKRRTVRNRSTTAPGV